MAFERLSRELAYEGAIIDVYRDRVQMPDGRVAEWDFIGHKGAAAVVPVLEDGRILMVRQYRNAIDRYTLEIPAGGRNTLEEDTADCAVRELEEEAGCRCGELELLIKLKTAVAFCNEFIDVYVARGLTRTSQHLDEDEFIDVEAYPLGELLEMIYAGELQDAKTVAALLAYSGKYASAGK